MEFQWLYHNSHDLNYRSPFGAISCQTRVNLRLDVYGTVDKVLLRQWKNHREEVQEMTVFSEDMEKKQFVAEITAPLEPGHLWYFFIVIRDGKTYYYGNNHFNYGGPGQIYHGEPPSYQITVFKDNITPSWFKDAVMYQIFVDRFFGEGESKEISEGKKSKYKYYYRDWEEAVPIYDIDSNTGEIVGYDIYGGNLLGVIKKLPYLKSLGVNVIYLNPIFQSPSNHKYDISDYKKVDSMFGDNQLFEELCNRAKEYGIDIILDGVFSHTGSDSIYFNKEGNYPSLGAYQSEESPYYSWYCFQRQCDEYHCWWGIDTLPNVNEMDPSFRDFIIHNDESVIKYWMKKGAKGWRLDVADELPDQFIKEIRSAMKKIDPDSVLIGEVWEDASRKVSYNKLREYLLGEELDSVMNYPFRNNLLDFLVGKQDSYTTCWSLMSLKENYPKHNFYANMNLLGSHDVPRILTLLGDAPDPDSLSREEQYQFKLSCEQKEVAVKRLKLLSLMQMTFPGVPCIYYGDEVGMEGFKDPLNRGPFPWGKENMELSQWYRHIIGLRNSYAIFRTGEWIPLDVSEDVLAYVRVIENGKDIFGQMREDNVAVVVINRNKSHGWDLTLRLKEFLQEGELYNGLSNDQSVEITEGKVQLHIPPLAGQVWIKSLLK